MEPGRKTRFNRVRLFVVDVSASGAKVGDDDENDDSADAETFFRAAEDEDKEEEEEDFG